MRAALCFLAGGSFAVVVGPAGTVGQGGECGEEEGSFELFVPAADGGAGAAGDGREAGVAGEVSASRERGAVANLEQDACSGPDADAGDRGQDLGKRVCVEHLLDLPGGVGSLGQESLEGGGELRRDQFGGAGAGDGDGLFGPRLLDRVDELVVGAWGVWLGDGDELAPGEAASPCGPP
jgi:hypothetical protein